MSRRENRHRPECRPADAASWRLSIRLLFVFDRIDVVGKLGSLVLPGDQHGITPVPRDKARA
jgi:hypothetical protein